MHLTMFMADKAGELNCSLHNIIIRAKYINKLYPGIHQVDTFDIDDLERMTPEVRESVDKADLVILERNVFGGKLVRLTEMFVSNKKVAIIFDDSYDTITPNNAAYDFWNKSMTPVKLNTGEIQVVKVVPNVISQLRRSVRMSKAFIAPSRVLASDWSKYTPAFIIHNSLDPERYPEDAQPLFPHDDIVIGWCGSMSHVESFTDSGILPALTYVGRKYPNVRIMCGGDKRVFDKLNLPENKKLFSPFVPEDQWVSLQKSIDIGLAPLATAFDRRRSWIKVLEYMYMKIPWIATNFETYEELGEFGTLVDNSVDNWKKALCEVIENIDKYRELANTKAYEFAKAQTYEEGVKEFLTVCEQIINMPDKDD